MRTNYTTIGGGTFGDLLDDIFGGDDDEPTKGGGTVIIK